MQSAASRRVCFLLFSDRGQLLICLILRKLFVGLLLFAGVLFTLACTPFTVSERTEALRTGQDVPNTPSASPAPTASPSPAPTAPGKYVLKEDFSGADFFDHFQFETFDDPTHGYVNYVDAATAKQKSLISIHPTKIGRAHV